MNAQREARMTLAALSEPGDTVTGALAARLGSARLDSTETVQLITSGVRLPNGIDPAEGELWRRRLAPRINPGQIDRIVADMERHDLRMLTPDDIDWPGELQQLGTSAPQNSPPKAERSSPAAPTASTNQHTEQPSCPSPVRRSPCSPPALTASTQPATSNSSNASNRAAACSSANSRRAPLPLGGASSNETGCSRPCPARRSSSRQAIDPAH